MNSETGFALLLANMGVALLILAGAVMYKMYLTTLPPVEGAFKTVETVDPNATVAARKLLVELKTAIKEDVGYDLYNRCNVETSIAYQFKNGEWVIVKGAQ